MSCEDDYIHQQTNNNLRELRKKSTERRQASLLDTKYTCGINESLRPNRNDEKTKEARNRERGYHRKNPKRHEKLRTFKSQDEPETTMTRTYQIGNSQDQNFGNLELGRTVMESEQGGTYMSGHHQSSDRPCLLVSLKGNKVCLLGKLLRRLRGFILRYHPLWSVLSGIHALIRSVRSTGRV
jgi:hypothetical protein